MSSANSTCQAPGCNCATAWIGDNPGGLCAVHWISSGHAAVLELTQYSPQAPEELAPLMSTANVVASSELFSRWIQVLTEAGSGALRLDSPRTNDGSGLVLVIDVGTDLTITDPPSGMKVSGPTDPRDVREEGAVWVTITDANVLELAIECRANVNVSGYTSLDFFWGGGEASALLTCRPGWGHGPTALHLRVDDEGPLTLDARLAAATRVQLHGGYRRQGPAGRVRYRRDSLWHGADRG